MIRGVYLATSKPTAHIEGASAYLWEKYTNFKPTFISNGSDSVKKWCANMYDHLYNEGFEYNDYIIFGLEDMLPIDYWNDELFQWVMSYSPDRYELGWGALNKKEVEMINGEIGMLTKKSPYRLSTQISVWRYGVLLKFLDQGAAENWTPHDFETHGTNASRKYDLKILGTKTKFAFRWIEETALSKKWLPGKINVLGLRTGVIEDLCDKGLLDKAKINFGIKGNTPRLIRSTIGRKYREFYGD